MKILIVYGYHPKEKFAIRVGERLLESIADPRIKVVKYTGKHDYEKSNYNLRKFIASFGPEISLVLHDTDNLQTFSAAIIYCTPHALKRENVLKHLSDFTIRQADTLESPLTCCGSFFTPNASCSFIDIEFNPRIGLLGAENLMNNFSRYLLGLMSANKLKF
jgi:hypothetical protein